MSKLCVVKAALEQAEAGGEPIRPHFRARPFVLGDPSHIPPRRWLYGRHLISGFVSLTVSPGGIGKSSLVLVEALAMASGRPLLGDAPSRPLRVWCWNGEDPFDELQRRIAAACLHYGLTDKGLGGRLLVDSGRDMPIMLAQATGSGFVPDDAAADAIAETIKAQEIDVVIIDPFVTTHMVPENDNAAINAVVALWRRIADRTGCAVELVHHAKKEALLHGAALGMSQARGAGALLDGVRSARFLVPMTMDEAAKAGVETHRGLFRVETGKANLAPASTRATWRKLEPVSLGNGTAAYPEGDAVGVATSWDWPDAFGGVELAHLEEVKRRLRSSAPLDGRESDQAKDWAGCIVAEVLGLDVGPTQKADRSPTQNSARAKVRNVLRTWVANGELVAVQRQDKRAGRLVTVLRPAGEDGDPC